jgi:hypothetical protein
MAEGIDKEKLDRRHIEVISFLLNADPHVTGGFTKWKAQPLKAKYPIQVVYDSSSVSGHVEVYKPPMSMGLTPRLMGKVPEGWDGIVTIGILDIPKYFKRKGTTMQVQEDIPKVSYVAVNSFCHRHTAESPFSHADVPLQDVANILNVYLLSVAILEIKEGYKPAVGRTLVVRVDLDRCKFNFYSGITLIRPTDKVIQGFRSRVEGELPRPFKEVVRDSKPLAKTVDLIYYNTTALAATGDTTLTTNSPDSTWELVSILAAEDDNLDSPPPTPLAVLSNYLGCDGGTKTSETRKEFTEHLNKSLDYWECRANVVIKQEDL